ncbi:hypothetical protein TRIP_B200208 [uncultured Desulfatiglans sp.]|uniref:Uncharacterized protein n=1 Tax=Uncultured Desulfatiglans sp. TaxID=1748965 RepID=A0A653A293_UNCDX|nr:hypothetical protein TRIP_B200208 [uncultured Desulfatiglans sp.]
MLPISWKARASGSCLGRGAWRPGWKRPSRIQLPGNEDFFAHVSSTQTGRLTAGPGFADAKGIKHLFRGGLQVSGLANAQILRRLAEKSIPGGNGATGLTGSAARSKGEACARCLCSRRLRGGIDAGKDI